MTKDDSLYYLTVATDNGFIVLHGDEMHVAATPRSIAMVQSVLNNKIYQGSSKDRKNKKVEYIEVKSGKTSLKK